eukprot:CAMPEP_0176495948 /NCGR_PEP_ID=MMETSP0200_2-20121128/10935_1 /TAXON_ID=947934 /ORGANISM="Chaetoceros sp., Strain GSL56" /LENGTH=39 /DNA_ID= /DNA_START= /DNA_END= /DNA_ORIENTATION=
MTVPKIAALCPIERNEENGLAALKIPVLASSIAPADPGA